MNDDDFVILIEETKMEFTHLQSDLSRIEHKILSLVVGDSSLTLSRTLKALAGDLTAKGLGTEAAAVDQARLIGMEMKKLVKDNLARRISLLGVQSKLEDLLAAEKDKMQRDMINKADELLAAEKEKRVKLYDRLLRLTESRDAIQTHAAILREVNKNLHLEIKEMEEKKKSDDPKTMMMMAPAPAPAVHDVKEMSIDKKNNHLIQGKKLFQRTLSLLKSYPETMIQDFVLSAIEDDDDVEMDEEMATVIEVITINLEKIRHKKEELSNKYESLEFALAQLTLKIKK